MPHGTWWSAASQPLALLLAQLALILLATRLGGRLARAAGQPAVTGEILAGLALGPSLLGAAWPRAAAALFPPESLGRLGLFGQMGALFFMFAVGMDLDLGALRAKRGPALAISPAGILPPFLLGAALAPWLHRRYAPAGTSPGVFAAFCGVAMAITAFPVLARILRERGLDRKPVGVLALGAAAFEDATAWCLLALVLAWARGQGWRGALPTVAAALVLAGAAVLGLRPLLAARLPAFKTKEYGGGTLFAGLLLVLGLAWATEAIGIHALFGAFLAGAVLPREGRLLAFLRQRLVDGPAILLLPVFFAFTGLRTRLGLLPHPADWLACLAVLVAAVGGKLGGVWVAARASGLPGREAFALGALMNTRGLMELIALNLGLDLGILSPAAFAIFVLMALCTTAMTGPLLNALGIGKVTPAGD